MPRTPTKERLAFADVVLLNKTGLVGAEEVARVETRIACINPYATVHRMQRCNVDLNRVLGKEAFNLDRILEF